MADTNGAEWADTEWTDGQTDGQTARKPIAPPPPVSPVGEFGKPSGRTQSGLTNRQTDGRTDWQTARKPIVPPVSTVGDQLNIPLVGLKMFERRCNFSWLMFSTIRSGWWVTTLKMAKTDLILGKIFRPNRRLQPPPPTPPHRTIPLSRSANVSTKETHRSVSYANVLYSIYIYMHRCKRHLYLNPLDVSPMIIPLKDTFSHALMGLWYTKNVYH